MAANPESSSFPACRLTKGRDPSGSICVTVATTRLLHVRRAIVQARITNVSIMKATPLACGSRVRLTLTVPVAAIQQLMERIAIAAREAD